MKRFASYMTNDLSPCHCHSERAGEEERGAGARDAFAPYSLGLMNIASPNESMR